MSLPTEILIESELHTSAQLQAMLGTHGAIEPAVLQSRTSPDAGMRLDPVTLAAIIGGSATVLAAVITGVIAAMSKSAETPSTIRVVLRDQRTIEVPANTSPERIRALVEMLERQEPVRIYIARAPA